MNNHHWGGKNQPNFKFLFKFLLLTLLLLKIWEKNFFLLTPFAETVWILKLFPKSTGCSQTMDFPTHGSFQTIDHLVLRYLLTGEEVGCGVPLLLVTHGVTISFYFSHLSIIVIDVLNIFVVRVSSLPPSLKIFIQVCVSEIGCCHYLEFNFIRFICN